MGKPATTRLRYVKASAAAQVVAFLDRLGKRVQIYGAPVWVDKDKSWYLWFVPSDDGADIKSVEIKK
jgi:hypothetical protein